jgi:putative transposase
MDFVSDRLFDGRRFRLLTLVDNFTRESLAIRRGQRLTGDDVGAVLQQLQAERGKPQSICIDNSLEFISKPLDWRAYFNEVTLDFSRPGKPTDNPFVESFNGRLRQECLKPRVFHRQTTDNPRIVMANAVGSGTEPSAATLVATKPY